MIFGILIFIVGAIVGSFLNVCIHRIPKEESIAYPASHCPKCNAPIAWYDNVPILSWLILHGKCRNCRNSISLRYPIVELTTAILFLYNFSLFGFRISDLGFYFNLIFIAYLIIVFFIDLETELLPDIPSYIIIALGLIKGFLSGDFIGSAMGTIIGFGVLWGINALAKLYYKKDGIGEGDFRLAAAFGAFFGLAGLFNSLFLGYLIGAIVSIGLLLTKKKTLSDYIPFGPSLALGALITLFWRNWVIQLLFFK